ncbi:hypothetical protein [Oricola sp.]|uniref:hypothetical protein n=1 Tax=Oricola sp. TaxID=1979950 RepID=UPI0025D71D85|nr:hypothetical protein [Oricola sp.]MCI5073521.1 hypothetical protein [Oricola sp.]
MRPYRAFYWKLTQTLVRDVMSMLSNFIFAISLATLIFNVFTIDIHEYMMKIIASYQYIFYSAINFVLTVLRWIIGIEISMPDYAKDIVILWTGLCGIYLRAEMIFVRSIANGDVDVYKDMKDVDLILYRLWINHKNDPLAAKARILALFEDYEMYEEMYPSLDERQKNLDSVASSIVHGTKIIEHKRRSPDFLMAVCLPSLIFFIPFVYLRGCLSPNLAHSFRIEGNGERLRMVVRFRSYLLTSTVISIITALFLVVLGAASSFYAS